MNHNYRSNLKQIDQLQLPIGQFTIWGSGPLAIRNLREAHDIDIIVKWNLWENLSKKYEVEGPKKNVIRIMDMEIFNDCLNITDKLDEIIDNSEIIEGYPFMPLSYVIEWKKYYNREKDHNDIALIKEYLKKNKKQM